MFINIPLNKNMDMLHLVVFHLDATNVKHLSLVYDFSEFNLSRFCVLKILLSDPMV